ncbi:hypothetical protein YC2023_117643 [Brassica napus]
MDSQQVRLDSLEDLLDVMAVGNPVMQRMLSERRAALGMPPRDPQDYVQHHESQCMDQDCLVSWSQHNQTDKEERRLIISRTQGLTITHSKHS